MRPCVWVIDGSGVPLGWGVPSRETQCARSWDSRDSTLASHCLAQSLRDDQGCRFLPLEKLVALADEVRTRGEDAPGVIATISEGQDSRWVGEKGIVPLGHQNLSYNNNMDQAA